MAIAPPTPEVRKFLNALEGFLENPPRDLPEGALDTMNDLRKELKGYSGGDELSPGERELIRQQGGDPEAERVETKDDGLSPGERAQQVAEQAQQVAAALSGSGSAD